MANKLPRIDQPILVEFDIKDLPEVRSSLLAGEYAAAVIRAAQYDDFDRDVLSCFTIGNRRSTVQEIHQRALPAPAVRGPLRREIIHLEETESSPGTKIPFEREVSLARVTNGVCTLAAAGASGRVRAYTGSKYAEEKDRLSRHIRVRGLYTSEPVKGLNKTISVEHSGVRGDLGAIRLGIGDVGVFPQGGGDSVSPSWHGIITPPNTERDSVSHHILTD